MISRRFNLFNRCSILLASSRLEKFVEKQFEQEEGCVVISSYCHERKKKSSRVSHLNNFQIIFFSARNPQARFGHAPLSA